MPTPIVVKIGDLELTGEFNDTPAGKAAAAALPFEWSGSRWGDEYYGPPTADIGDHPCFLGPPRPAVAMRPRQRFRF